MIARRNFLMHFALLCLGQRGTLAGANSLDEVEIVWRLLPAYEEEIARTLPFKGQIEEAKDEKGTAVLVIVGIVALPYLVDG